MKLNEDDEVPSFSMIFKGNDILSESCNQVEVLQDISAHSEILAIRLAQEKINSRYLVECTLVTTLEPCTMCAGAIILARIESVYYLAPAGKYDGISSLSFENIYQKNHFPKLIIVKNPEASQLIKNFFKKKR